MTETQLSESQASEQDASPNGSAWAALLAGGVGAAAFGVFTILSESLPAVSKALQWYRPSGALSGVAVSAIIIWAAVWAALHGLWKSARIQHQKALLAVISLLVIAALLATFPPFYELFAKGD